MYALAFTNTHIRINKTINTIPFCNIFLLCIKIHNITVHVYTDLVETMMKKQHNSTYIRGFSGNHGE